MFGLWTLIITALSISTVAAAWAGGVSTATGGARTVTVSGVGDTREAAIQAALRLAVQEVLGGRLAALTEVQNGKLSAHHIHFHSNGVVEHYQLLHEERRADQFHVRIRADVRRGEGNSLTGAHVDGRRLLALAETRHQRRTTAASAWTDYVEQWCERVAVVRPVATEPRRGSGEAREIELAQTLQVTVDRDRYGQTVSELRILLDSVASARGRFSAWMVSEPAPENLPLWRSGFPHGDDSSRGLQWLQFGTVRTCHGVRVTAKEDDLWAATSAGKTSMLVFVQSEAVSATSSESWRWYCVPVTESFQPPRTELEVTLADEQGGSLQQHVWSFGERVPGYSHQQRTFGREIPSIVLAPAWVAHTGTTSTRESLISTRSASLVVTLSVPVEKVARIRRIKAQLVTAPRWESASPYGRQVYR